MTFALCLGLRTQGQANNLSLAPEASALIARMTAKPTALRSKLISRAVASLKAAGVWTKLDALYLLAAHDSQAAKLNWIADAYNCSEVSSPAFVADRGFTGNGTSHLSTGFNPTTASSPKFVQDSACIGVWPIAGAAENKSDIGGGNTRIDVWNGDGSRSLRLNQNSTTFGGGGALGLGGLNRESATGITTSLSGNRVGAVTIASAAPSSATFLIGSGPSGGTTRQQSAAYFGQSLTATEETALYNALRAYLQGVGAVA